MTDEPCRSVRAQARSLEQEVELLRGAVAALRESSRRSRARETHQDPRRWKIATVAFFVGVVVGAMTLIVLTRFI